LMIAQVPDEFFEEPCEEPLRIHSDKIVIFRFKKNPFLLFLHIPGRH
jgi:hypothetical protein